MRHYSCIDSIANYILLKIDNYIKSNFDVLAGNDLYSFYCKLTDLLKNKYFGGSWGFQGIIELLIFRILHYLLLTNNYETINYTKNLKAFYYPDKQLVLGAGLPLYINSKKIGQILLFISQIKTILKL